MQNGEINQLDRLIRDINYRLNYITKKYLVQEGLTLPRFWAMKHLNTDHPLTMSELQKQMFIAPATLTGLIDGLVQGGYVERWREETDRRSVFLKLTPQGNDLVSRINELRDEHLSRAVLENTSINVNVLIQELESIFIHLPEES